MHRSTMRYSLLLVCMLTAMAGYAQIGSKPGSSAAPPSNINEYELAPVTVIPKPEFLDEDLLIAVTGLNPGDKVRLPHDEKIAKAIRNLWKQDLFANVNITVTRIVGDKVFLNIAVEERPRLSRKNFRGVKKSEATELNEKINIVTNRVVTEGIKKESVVRIRKYFIDKGFGNVTVGVRERKDSLKANAVILVFDVNKGKKTHINQVNIAGNEEVADSRIKRAMKGTKEMSRITLHPQDDRSVYGENARDVPAYLRNFGYMSPTKTLDLFDPYFRFKLLSSSKFNEQKFDDDKQSIVAAYNALGYRDAAVVADTVYPVASGNLNVDVKVSEGRRYYFGDITWKGNTKYSSDALSRLLGIKKGDIYNQQLLDSRLGRQISPEGGEDISSLYMDDGYLFFNVEANEVSISGDTINYEMRVTEGQQAIIGAVNIYGNDRTNEHVIRREIYTLPGNKFSRTDLIRSVRQISNLGFFDPEKITPQPRPHPENGTVDIDYTVTEKSSDQLQLSAGFGGGIRFYGNIGITFNNFSLRNIFHPKAWDPLPVGDGQKFSLSYQSNGPLYNSFTTSFTEPWLGGKKPTGLTTSFTYSRFSGQSDIRYADTSFIRTVGGALSLSKRLKWPDDNFVLVYGLNYQNYYLRQYQLISGFSNGRSNNLYLKLALNRYSVDQPLYPRSGSNISLTMQFTPPYSSIAGRDYTNAPAAEKYKLIEYHKYRFTADWYQKVAGNLVFKLSTKLGYMGYYNKSLGFSPFERFQLGGDGLSGSSYFIGRDIISQRGYEVYMDDATIFNKFSAELRYPFSLSAASTIYALAFVDAANAWSNFKNYNPFNLRRDAGVGIRLFLPMFGLLGLDYGVGFDRYDPSTNTTKFKDISKFTFMLGFEPD